VVRQLIAGENEKGRIQRGGNSGGEMFHGIENFSDWVERLKLKRKKREKGREGSRKRRRSLEKEISKNSLGRLLYLSHGRNKVQKGSHGKSQGGGKGFTFYLNVLKCP